MKFGKECGKRPPLSWAFKTLKKLKLFAQARVRRAWANFFLTCPERGRIWGLVPSEVEGYTLFMKDELKVIVEGSLDTLFPNDREQIDFIIENPVEMSHGDYSTNVAMVLAKKEGKSPREVAESLVKDLESRDLPYFQKIEIAGPGFINFFLNQETIHKMIVKADLKAETFGKSKLLEGKDILIEFTDPNPFKEFHIGHLMNNTIGEALSRIHEANMGKVKRLCYQGDVGPHVAKAVWGMIQNKSIFPHEDDGIEDKIKFTGNSYVFGNTEYEENPKSKDEIDEINKKLFEKSDQELQNYYDQGRQWSLQYFDSIYGKLGTNFDKFYFESDTAPVGKQIVMEYLKEGVFEKSEGAIIYDGERDGLHKRVFINSKGLPTYEAKDLGLASLKEEDFEYDASIILTGNEQAQYFKVLLAALDKVSKEIADKTINLNHGLMKIDGKKTSSRKGGVLSAMELLSEAEKLIEEKLKDRNLTGDEKEEVKEIVSIGAVKYSILKQAIGKDIEFDFEKSLSFEGDSGPYLQYTYTRAKSVLDTAQKEGIDYNEEAMPTDSWKTSNLERIIFQYEDVIKQSFRELAPQHLVTYLTRLASEFNSFYASNKFVDKADESSPYKLSIAAATMITIKNGLHTLGIKAPPKM
jgi:arginyl-tRNA synthetase